MRILYRTLNFMQIEWFAKPRDNKVLRQLCYPSFHNRSRFWFNRSVQFGRRRGEFALHCSVQLAIDSPIDLSFQFQMHFLCIFGHFLVFIPVAVSGISCFGGELIDEMGEFIRVRFTRNRLSHYFIDTARKNNLVHKESSYNVKLLFS